MAPTPRNLTRRTPWVRAGAVGCVLAALASHLSAAPAHKADTDKQVDATSVVVDNKTQTADYKDIVLRQDDMTVQADHAHQVGLTFDKSDWTFEGNVRVQSQDGGSLHSDQALVEFRDKRLTRVTVSGTPAEFEQKRTDSDLVTHGHANQIVYDVGDGTIQLSKDAWLSDGRSSMTSQLVVYNIREQKVQASTPAGSDGRVHMTIAPNGKLEPAKTQP